jgi:hypothetical protein
LRSSNKDAPLLEPLSIVEGSMPRDAIIGSLYRLGVAADAAQQALHTATDFLRREVAKVSAMQQRVSDARDGNSAIMLASSRLRALEARHLRLTDVAAGRRVEGIADAGVWSRVCMRGKPYCIVL